MKTDETPPAEETASSPSSSINNKVTFQLTVPTGRPLGLRLDQSNRVVEIVSSFAAQVVKCMVQVGDTVIRVDGVDVRDKGHTLVAQLVSAKNNDTSNKQNIQRVLFEFERIILDEPSTSTKKDPNETICSRCHSKISKWRCFGNH